MALLQGVIVPIDTIKLIEVSDIKLYSQLKKDYEFLETYLNNENFKATFINDLRNLNSYLLYPNNTTLKDLGRILITHNKELVKTLVKENIKQFENNAKDVNVYKKDLRELRDQIESSCENEKTFHEQRAKDFTIEFNADLTKLNEAITKYKSTSDVDKKDQLNLIFQQKETIDQKYPGSLISGCKAYQDNLQTKLFAQLKEEYNNIGVKSICTINGNEQLNLGQLPELLANMPTEKVAILAKHLSSTPPPTTLINPYKDKEESYQEFQDFLSTHDFTFLGSDNSPGNSRNYKLINNDTKQPVVLKVEERLEQPLSADAEVREGKVGAFLTPIEGARQVTYQDKSNISHTKTLLVTTYCSGGDLQSDLTKTRNEDERIKSALDVYTQMASILKDLNEDHYFFSDMKNSNWLISDNKSKKLQIADTKAFIPTDEDGFYDSNNKKNEWFSLVKTDSMLWPECRDDSFSADKAHAFMLGKNIYQYLTQVNFKELKDKNSKSFDFDIDVFTKTDEGEELKQLIIKLTDPDANSRLSISAALNELNTIKSNIETNQQDCKNLVAEIEAMKLPDDDKIIVYRSNLPEDMDTISRRKEALAYLQPIKELATIKKECYELAADDIDNQIKYETAIKEMLDIDDLKRVKDIIKATHQENLSEITQDCERLLTSINNKGFGEQDSVVDTFVNEKKQSVRTEKSITKLKEIHSELEKIDKNPMLNEMHKKYKTISRRFIRGHQKKTAIETAMGQLSLDERTKIFDTPYDTSDVKKAFAQKRGVLKLYLPVNEDKAASSYKELKNKYDEIKKSEQTNETQSTLNNSTKGQL